MESFKKFVSEASVYHSVEHPNNLGGSLEINTAQLSDPAVRRRLNAIVVHLIYHYLCSVVVLVKMKTHDMMSL